MISLSALRTSTDIDLATAELSYEAFRALAQNPHLSANERIGFPDTYRSGFDRQIFEDILTKLPVLTDGTPKTVVDIGAGCGQLATMLIEWCADHHHNMVLVDSKEMLAHLQNCPSSMRKVEGKYPDCLSSVREALGIRGADAILCYSVLHYLYRDANVFDVLDSTMELLASGGIALFGDIPNESKRRRFFASSSGKAFHRKFMNTDKDPVVHFNTPCNGKIDDSFLAACVARAQASGCHAYVIPQPEGLPMSNRRDDLVIKKP